MKMFPTHILNPLNIIRHKFSFRTRCPVRVFPWTIRDGWKSYIVCFFILFVLTLPLVGQDGDSVRFAIIGDFGRQGKLEEDVANLVKSWHPDFIITTGDNNYPKGKASTIDDNIGQYYHDYIFPYIGEYGAGADKNRFFPSLGNHDSDCSNCPQPYLDYFTLPGNERYYDFTWGPVHFFAINSNTKESDGIDSTSIQAQWLKTQLSASTKPFQLVYMHHPPYSSGPHGSTAIMQWPYKNWGADAVIAGHDHTYERIVMNDLLYIVNGLGGGGGLYSFISPIKGSEIRYNEDYGAMLVEVNHEKAVFQFITRSGQVIDTYEIRAPGKY